MSTTLPDSVVLGSAPNGQASLRRCTASLNIIVANDFAHVNGGAAQVALSSAIGLAGHGHNVTLFAAVAPIASGLQDSGVALVLTNQYDIKSDPKRLRAAAQGIWNPRAARKMKELLSRSVPDQTILHVHGWTKALSSSIIHAAIGRGFHVVVTMHDYFYACPTGGFFNFRTRQACPLRPLSAACLREKCDRDGYAEKLWRCTRQAVQNTLGLPRSPLLSFITLSDFSENVLRPFFPSEAAIYRLDNPNDFVKEPPIDVESNIHFASVGRLTPEKGPDLLAKAARDLNCEVTFVGEGPSREAVASIMPHAQITGWQSRESVRSHLREARALVLASLWYEAQPLVVLEAAAMGIPAVVPDQCAARELVENGITGLWFRSGDYADLRDKMDILRRAQNAARMGQAAYDRYWANPFTLERHVISLEQCYRAILKMARHLKVAN
jgi:glycosyltransferase involved in cell wall biosynthesis